MHKFLVQGAISENINWSSIYEYHKRLDLYLTTNWMTDRPTDQPTLWSTVLLAKLTVTQLVMKFSPFMEPEVSLPCSQKPAIGPHPKTDTSSPIFPPYFPKIHSNINLHLHLGLLSSLLFRNFWPKFWIHLSPMHATCTANLTLFDLITLIIFGEAYNFHVEPHTYQITSKSNL
jgi:hypothetical protein